MSHNAISDTPLLKSNKYWELKAANIEMPNNMKMKIAKKCCGTDFLTSIILIVLGQLLPIFNEELIAQNALSCIQPLLIIGSIFCSIVGAFLMIRSITNY